ncbi:MAG: tRNA (guanosine(37)-N1)-methyltransferase TrmD [Spirochaetia bacterium]|nr:tRNA (guanosine(37)-N1)-methyltransferase TrmD [Spirochaetia bacterium]
MKINIITLYPEYFESPLKQGLLGKCIEKKNLIVEIINLRSYAVNKHGQVDDAVYGGGSGMLLMIEPIYGALEDIKKKEKTYTILLSAAAPIMEQKKLKEYHEFFNEDSDLRYESVTLICGHFEGVDQRVADYVADEEISVGKFILSGGEPAALVFIDAIARLIPGYMGNPESLKEESFEHPDYLEYPQYTRPADFKGMKVPDILLSGNHNEIKKWRDEASDKKTKQ